jgi:hypothetical protein
VIPDLLLAADDGSRNPGPIPLFIVLLLAVVTALLIRNMTGRIKRLPPSFPDQPETDETDEEDADRPPTSDGRP